MTYNQDKEDNEIRLIKLKKRGFEGIINKLEIEQKQNREYLDNTLKRLFEKKQKNQESLIDIKKEIQNVKTNMRQNNKTLIEDVKKIFLKNKEILDE